jgi:hypothetical protein
MLAFDYNGDRLERLNAAVAEACPDRAKGMARDLAKGRVRGAERGKTGGSWQ